MEWRDKSGNWHSVQQLGENQCDLNYHAWLSDSEILSNKSLLPITGVKYGPMPFEAQKLKIKVGSLRCEPPIVDESYSLFDHVTQLDDRVVKLEDPEQFSNVTEEISDLRHRVLTLENLEGQDKIDDRVAKLEDLEQSNNDTEEIGDLTQRVLTLENLEDQDNLFHQEQSNQIQRLENILDIVELEKISENPCAQNFGNDKYQVIDAICHYFETSA